MKPYCITHKEVSWNDRCSLRSALPAALCGQTAVEHVVSQVCRLWIPAERATTQRLDNRFFRVFSCFSHGGQNPVDGDDDARNLCSETSKFWWMALASPNARAKTTVFLGSSTRQVAPQINGKKLLPWKIYKKGTRQDQNWLVVWNMFYLPMYWE